MKISVSRDISGFRFYGNLGGYFDSGGYSWKKLKTNGYLHFFWEIFCETLYLT